MSRRSSTASSAGRRLHLDVFSGIAGDMMLGALLDLGLPRKTLLEDLAGLDLEFKLVVRRVQRGALAARQVAVRIPGAKGPRARRAQSGGAKHAPSGGEKAVPRRGAKTRAEPHGVPPGHSHAHSHSHGRSYRSIEKQLAKAKLDAPVRERAVAAFHALARAEAAVHGTTLDAVHFHEVGAVDALVDVVGACIGLHRLGIERVTASPVALGHGMLEMAHGLLPLPAPAVLELLRGVPTVPAHVDWETVTPTGAALLKASVEEYGPLPAMTIEAIGHGAGGDRKGPVPNVLRAVLGRDAAATRDRIVAMETNLDDLVPEHFDHLMERLLEAGALDVSLQHLQMKKNRPGFLVRVLARPADRIPLARILFAESSAIGVRTSEWDRLVLPRETRRVATPFGRIAVKVVHGERGASVSAEYDDCKRAARRHEVPLREVVRVAEEAARQALD